ncbi:MAG: nucleotidyltransferase domain-containing protein [Clostridiales bacterium]|nr:nucleotidyltransferase domain-containing protein [Clostridiales bacterium]
MDKIYTIHEIQTLVNPILQKYDVERAFLFGSYARGDATDKSDIDLRIDRGGIKSLLQLSGLTNSLINALGKSVDVVTSESLHQKANVKRSAAFRASIGKEEQLIYEREQAS